MTDLMTTEEAALDLAVRFSIGDSFTVAANVGMTCSLGRDLAAVPEWVAYMDNGEGTVMRTDQDEAVPVVALMETVGLVVLIPKTIAPEVVGEALGTEIPEDWSSDFLLRGEQLPQLFLDATDLATPQIPNPVPEG